MEIGNQVRSFKLSRNNCNSDTSDPCTEQKGIIDKTNTGELTTGKPIGGCGKGHKRGSKESISRITKGDGRILAPSHVLPSDNDMIPEPKLVTGKSEDRPVVYYSAPNRLVINEYWSASDAAKKRLEVNEYPMPTTKVVFKVTVRKSS